MADTKLSAFPWSQKIDYVDNHDFDISSISTKTAGASSSYIPAHLRGQLLKRCLRCKEYYNEATNNQGCTFHRLMFLPWSRRDFVGWTCCKQLEQDAAGCSHQAQHVEDLRFSGNLQQFPADCQVLERQWKRAAHAYNGNVDDEDDDAVAVDDGRSNAIVHRVTRTDTLAALALRYGVSAAQIKRVNRLPVMGSYIMHLDSLLIPQGSGLMQGEEVRVLQEDDEDDDQDEEEKDREQRKMRERAELSFAEMRGITRQEARYYLSVNEYHLKRAISHYREDVAFEEDQQEEDARRQQRGCLSFLLRKKPKVY